MAVTVTHPTVATLPDEPGAEVNKAEWNANHTIVGLGTAAEAATTDFDAAGAATAAVAAHELAGDPHPQYLTAAEGDALFLTPAEGDALFLTPAEGNAAYAAVAHKVSHQDGGADEISVLGLFGLLADAQTPLAHATSHKSAGGDAIKLDELAAPTDVTTLNATVAAHGLLPKLSGSGSTFLDGTGAFSTPVAAAGDTSKVISSGTSTIAADTCRAIVRRLTIASGAHLVIAATGSLGIFA